MKHFTGIILVTGLCTLVSCSSPPEKLAEKIVKASGGQKAWDNSRYFQFTFRVDRSDGKSFDRKHYWDRYSGNYRVEYTDKEQNPVIVLFNTGTKNGQVFINGVRTATDTLASKHLERAYRLFINDTYWLVSPLKLEEPGVNSEELPEEPVGKTNCRVLHIWFNSGTGLTPGDQYWFYADKHTGEVVRWKYLLQDESDTTFVDWGPYKELGGLKLPVIKTARDKSFRISFPDAAVLKDINPDLFDKP